MEFRNNHLATGLLWGVVCYLVMDWIAFFRGAPTPAPFLNTLYVEGLNGTLVAWVAGGVLWGWLLKRRARRRIPNQV